MKNLLFILLFLLAAVKSFTQPVTQLRTIANELINYKTYQSVCEFSFTFPYGRDTMTTETFVTLKKVEDDKLCGFYYDFETTENYINEKSFDFTIYFDSTVYSSYLGKVKKTSYHDSPSQFIDIKMEQGFVPAVQKRIFFYSITPYEIGKTILEMLNDSKMMATHKPDTLIEGETCLHYILQLKPDQEKNGKLVYELCFHKEKHYPVFYRRMTFASIVGNQMHKAQFRNTRINEELPKNYFSEENLLPAGWENSEPIKHEEKMETCMQLVGKKAPKWKLPVLGSDKTLSSNDLKSKTVLVEFTATWCGACFRAAKMMNRLETKFENNENIEIISIYSSNIDKKAAVEEFAQRLDAKPVILYSASEVEKQYHFQGYPTFFIINSKGIISRCIPGYSPAIEEEIIKDLEATALKK